MLSDLTFLFAARVKQSASIQKLLPAIINPVSTIDGFEQVMFFYNDYFPNSDLVDMWKSKWLAVSNEDMPHTISKAMQQCLQRIYLIFMLF